MGIVRAVFLVFFAGLVLSCSPSVPPLMPKESLFKLELGVLDDQIDLFLRSGLPSHEKNRFAFADGLVLVSNGNARKVMGFSSYGDLLTLYYNPETNPVPSLLGALDRSGSRNQAPVKNRQAFPYPFNQVGDVALSAGNQLYVEDKVPVERRVYDPQQRVVWESRILRFAKDGQFLDFLGQEGIGGTPFPSLERLTLTNKGDIVVTCRTGRGWQVWWYDKQGIPLAQYQLDLTQLPVPKGSDGLIPQLETLFPDWTLRELHLKIDYYEETMDATTSTASGIQVVQSLVWIWDLDRSTFSGHYGVPLLKRAPAKGTSDTPLGDRPWEFVGVNEAGAGFFVSSPENHSQRFLVLNRAGETLLERNIELEGADSLFAQYTISPKGILAAFLSDGSGAEIAWWRSDKLLGSYVQTGF